MRGLIDAVREAAHHRDTGQREIAREVARDTFAVRRHRPGADHGHCDLVAADKRAANVQRLRRIRTLRQVRGIGRIGAGQDHSSRRSESASARCSSAISALDSRSAMVRATRMTR